MLHCLSIPAVLAAALCSHRLTWILPVTAASKTIATAVGGPPTLSCRSRRGLATLSLQNPTQAAHDIEWYGQARRSAEQLRLGGGCQVSGPRHIFNTKASKGAHFLFRIFPTHLLYFLFGSNFPTEHGKLGVTLFRLTPKRRRTWFGARPCCWTWTTTKPCKIFGRPWI